jgi:putative nucleotidyltransferase with HDIG domain
MPIFTGPATTGETRTFTEDDLSLLRAIGDQAAQALMNARLYANAERRYEYLKALRTVDMAITASMDLRVTFNVILDQIMARLKVDAAAILLLDPHLQALEYAAGRGFRTKAIQQVSLRLGEGLAGRAVMEHQLLGVAHLRETLSGTERDAALREEGFCSYFALPLLVKGQVKGVLEIFHRSPLVLDPEWEEFLEILTEQAAIAVDNAALFENLQRSNAQLTQSYDTTLEGWVKAIDLRDKETEGHTQRVTELSIRLAREVGIPSEELVHIRRGALLHDIGKLGVPDAILHKPGTLTPEEYEIMKRHTGYAYEMLSPIPYLGPALDIPYCHHERWDGTGYPRGLKGETIPLSARIFAVVDTWDALRSDRPYRKGWPLDRVKEYLRARAGSHFDARMVHAFLEMIEKDPSLQMLPPTEEEDEVVIT